MADAAMEQQEERQQEEEQQPVPTFAMSTLDNISLADKSQEIKEEASTSIVKPVRESLLTLAAPQDVRPATSLADIAHIATLMQRGRSRSVGERQWTRVRAVMTWYTRLRRIKR